MKDRATPRVPQSLRKLDSKRWENITGKLVPGQTQQGSVHDDYVLDTILGEGAFGTVRVAIHRQTGDRHACKSIPKAKLVCEEDVADVEREIHVLNLVGGHANIAGLKATYEDKLHVHLVMELCEGGELFDRIIQQRTFSERQAAHYMRTMVEAVYHIHQLGVIHRDIKPENLLLATRWEAAELKLGDFGLSTFFKPRQTFQTLVGSQYYIAPEVLRREYSQQIDLWSLGVILYIMLCGMPPFWGDSRDQVFRRILRGRLDFASSPWPAISDAAKDCVRRLLTADPLQRATAKEILEHPWLMEQGEAPDRPLDSVVIERLRRFAAHNKLKKAALLVIGRSLSKEEIIGLQELFRMIDADGSGTITVGEMRAAIGNMGNSIPEDDLQRLMRAADVDGDGMVNYEEFVAATMHLNKLEKEEVCQRAFAHFDTDGSGFLSLEEIEAGLREYGGMTDAEIASLMDMVDANHDGQIDYQEFLIMMRANNGDLRQSADFLRNLHFDTSMLTTGTAPA